MGLTNYDIFHLLAVGQNLTLDPKGTFESTQELSREPHAVRVAPYLLCRDGYTHTEYSSTVPVGMGDHWITGSACEARRTIHGVPTLAIHYRWFTVMNQCTLR